MDNQQLNHELSDVVKCEPSDNYYDELTDATTETITMLHEVKPDLDAIAETDPGAVPDRADRNTETYNQQVKNEVYSGFEIEVKCEAIDYNFDNDPTNATTKQITGCWKDEPEAETMYSTTFICDHCNRQFTSKPSLEQHIVSNHNSAASDIVIVESVSLNRTRCDYKSYSVRKKQHASFHDENRTFVCGNCGYRFVSETTMQMHLKSHCNKPNRSVNPKLSTKSFDCNLCDYKTVKRGNLTRHKKHRHTGEKPHQCHCCDYKTVDRSTLNRHLRTHTGVKPYKCERCDYKSASKGDTTKHSKIHSREKLYLCDHCDYKCTGKKYLKSHLLYKHRVENRLQCDLCEYKCAMKTVLKYHRRTKHTGEKLLACGLCDYKCAVRSAMNLHSRVHTGDKPYKCTQCDYRCAGPSALLNHKKSKHSN